MVVEHSADRGIDQEPWSRRSVRSGDRI